MGRGFSSLGGTFESSFFPVTQKVFILPLPCMGEVGRYEEWLERVWLEGA